MKRFSAKAVEGSKQQDPTEHRQKRQATFKMVNFNPTDNNKVNLFKDTKYFEDYT